MPAFPRRSEQPPEGTGKYTVASRDSLLRNAEERSRATGQTLDEAAAVIVEDLERAAAAQTTRTAPLVPVCGVLVAVAGLLLKAEPSSARVSDFFLGLAVVSAVAGLTFLARGHFIYVGRRRIGLSPTADDITFARDSLVRKHANARRGGWLAGIGLACLILGILLGVHITLEFG
jgi:hypothetical protein